MKINKRFSKNDKGRDFVVGDIHGCLEQLNAELDRVEFDKENDRLFSVGDLVDRGPDNLECLQLVYEPWFFTVMGNHEDMMFEVCGGDGRVDPRLWFQNGGFWSTSTDHQLLADALNVADGKMALTFTIETEFGNIGISHAQPPCRDWAKCEAEDLDQHEVMTAIWARSLIEMGDDYDWKCENIDLTIHGHTPVLEHRRVGNALFIDTGSFVKELYGDEEQYKDYKGVQLLRIDNILEGSHD